MNKSNRAAPRDDSQSENERLNSEIEQLRRDQCGMCASSKWGPATRRPKKGRLRRWEHHYLLAPTQLAPCGAGRSFEREFQRMGEKRK
jgi:hypothetical protein